MALKEDLLQHGWTQSDLRTRLEESAGRPITEAAISNWKKRNSVPSKWIATLISVLGVDGLVSRTLGRDSVESPVAPPKKSASPEVPTYLADTNHVYPRAVASYQRDSQTLTPLDIESKVADALPTAIRHYWKRAVQVGSVMVHLDYLSDYAVFEVKSTYTSQVPASAYRSLFTLSLAQRLYMDDPRHYGLIIISPKDRYVSGLYEEQQKAGLLGIEVAVVDSPEKAAEMISFWEKQPSEHS